MFKKIILKIIRVIIITLIISIIGYLTDFLDTDSIIALVITITVFYIIDIFIETIKYRKRKKE